ncbi:D-isomer specific 2-hydroxyacid dehydrogenase NAD-binding protein [Burkholderia sp. SJ98]|uniref:2-hydroxyacid dehydrogenase n=1 Tax=Caballeronia zhejiangensis TaxID=871203 RepID=UPI00025BB610|nr:glyoxylate/hydroxypyruvate reductase A [Caballeronia zhejiangensis]EKS72452.1 D-isomer specific 2-hydroxyacid dehydrogenase NAD-binding protein [Burkholderia sp. SJ98]
MPATIAFLSRMSAEYQAPYLAALRSALPEETIQPLQALTPAQRALTTIAIVANPAPEDVAALPKLLWIQSLWAGVEQLVAGLPAGSPPVVRLVDPEMSRTMAEAVLAWTYYLHRDMPRYSRQQSMRVWQQHTYRRPSQFAVGLLGLGALGTEAARMLVNAGFVARGWSRSAKTVPGVETFAGEAGLDAVLASSDVVVSLMPLTEQTAGLLDARRLHMMKPGAGLINFSRGPIVVTQDLVAALDRRHLSHAVLDVFDVEPLPDTSGLWAHPAVTVLPHISAPTDHRTAAQVIATNIREFRSSGRIPGHVDMARGY